MLIYGAICFKYNEELYKLKVLQQEREIVINDSVNFYKNNSIDGIVNSFNKIIWVTYDSEDIEKRRTYNQGHLLSEYIKCNDINRIRNLEIKQGKELSKTKKSYMDDMFDEDVDMSIFALNIPKIDLNFPKVNGELHLKIANNLEIDIDSLNYSIIFDINNDKLIIVNEGDKSIITRENVNEFVALKQELSI